MSETEARRIFAACSDDRLSAALQDVLRNFRQNGWLTIDQAANLAEMSARSFQRRLAAEGETFARILEHTRAEFAKHLLKCTRRPLSEIASELGYTRVRDRPTQASRLTL